MKRSKKKFSEFNINVLKLMKGTIISQFIPLVAAPILTRIYSPEEFGVFAIYFALVSTLSILINGKYEFAIVLPKKQDYAYQIVILSWSIAVVLSLFALLIVWLFENKLVSLFENLKIESWIYYIPVTILITGLYQPLYYWFNREKKYGYMANGRVIQSSTMVFFQVCFGFLSKKTEQGLMLGQIMGQLISMIYLGFKFVKETKLINNPNRIKQLALAKRFIKFPKYLLISSAINNVSRQSPNMLLNVFYSASTAGFYLLIQRVMGAPIALLGGAIGDVFRQEASQSFARYGECHSVYKKTLKKLLVISIFPFITFYALSPFVFSIIFGEEWRVAGEYARILTPMFFMQFIVSPVSYVYIITEKQREDFFLQIVILISIISIYTAGFTIESLLFYFMLIFVFVYGFVLVRTYFLSKGRS